MADITANPDKFITEFYRFLMFVRSCDGDVPLSFVDKNTYLGREENFKSRIAELARKELEYEAWEESWIGTGKILERCRRAMNCAGNLVYSYQQARFRDVIDPAHKNHRPDAERALYDIYRSKPGEQEAAAFSQAIQVFGGHYDTIGYLFFIKDSSRFLPVSPIKLQQSLALIGADHPLAGKCSWDNYFGFIHIVRKVKTLMQDILPDIEVRLIDAHSFLWVISEDKYKDWTPGPDLQAGIEAATENYLNSNVTGNSSKKSTLTTYFTHNAKVTKMTKLRANGACQLCGLPAPFTDKKGEPYLETHHIIWLSRGGADSTDNTAALCPNCHTRMHIVDDQEDIQKLLNGVK